MGRSTIAPIATHREFTVASARFTQLKRSMRAIWTGEIAFGLVAVPVKLYSATNDLSPKFHMVHKDCGGRIQYKRFCSKEEIEVPWSEIEKGYQVSKGKYAVFSKEELAELEDEESAQGIDIAEFVDPGDVDMAFIEKTYWVGPAGKTTRSYQLLRDAMEKSGKIAIARVKIRSRTRLAQLRPRDGRFALDLMRFGDEMVPPTEVEVPTSKVAKGATKEIDLAVDLIERMAGRFDPAKHPDDYRRVVLAAVEHKEARDEIAEDEAEKQGSKRERGKVVDLADILAQSLRGVGQARSKKRAVTKRAPAAAARHGKRSAKPRTTKKTAHKTTTRKAARR